MFIPFLFCMVGRDTIFENRLEPIDRRRHAFYLTLSSRMLSNGSKYCRTVQTVVSREYKIFLKEIKERILSSQIKAAISVNRELITLYWEIGAAVGKKQHEEGWGAKAVEKLANDLKSTFPNMKGFSIRNIRFMVQFAREYDNCEIVKQLVSHKFHGDTISFFFRDLKP